MRDDTYGSAAYVARYGLTPGTALLFLGCVVFVTLAVTTPVDPTSRRYPIEVQWLFRIAVVLFCGGGGLTVLAVAARGGEALIVDRDGITFVGSRVIPFGPHSRAVHYAWVDVAEVVLFEQHMQGRLSTVRYPYLGVRVRPHAGDAATVYNLDSPVAHLPKVADVLAGSVAHVPDGVLKRSWAIAGWRLDEGRLCAAVAHHAPEVGVVRLNDVGRKRRVRVSRKHAAGGRQGPPQNSRSSSDARPRSRS